MGNLKKTTKQAACSGILDEILRTPELGRTFDPEKHEIDPTKTHLNYGLIDHGMSPTDYLNKRLSEVKVQNRADVKVLGQWVWTMPKDLEPQYQEQFFDEIVKYNIEKFGAENICYAQVHLDERTPHLHLGIIPIVKVDKARTDGKTEKCCAKDVFTRAYLQHAHADLQKHLEDKLGVEVNLLNGETLGVEGIANYKKAKDLAKQIPVLQATINELNEEIKEKRKEIKQLDAEISKKKGFLESLKDVVSDLQEKVKEVLEAIKGHPNMLAMFYHWLTGGEKEEEEVVEKVKEYTDDMEISLTAVNNIIIPDEEPEEPTRHRGQDYTR